jgi:hypothetical protein
VTESKPERYTFPHVQELKSPIRFGDTTTERLEYACLKMRAVRNLGLSFADTGKTLSWDHVIKLAHAMTGKAPAKLDEMEAEDAAEMFSVVMFAWGKFLPTGDDE